MNQVLRRQLADVVSSRGPTAGKYLVVSVVNLLNHLIVLYVANIGWGWTAGKANVFAAVLAAIPAYILSRYWVWEVRGRHSLWSEIVPFWSLSLIGLLVSSVLAEMAERSLGTGVWVGVGSMAGYGLVWVAKFAFLDGMFSRSSARVSEAAVEAQ